MAACVAPERSFCTWWRQPERFERLRRINTDTEAVYHQRYSRIAMGVVRVSAGNDIGRVTMGRVEQHVVQVGIPLDEPRNPASCQSGHVLPDHDLRVAAGASADADGWDPQCLGNLPSQARRGLGWHDQFVAHDLITGQYWNWSEHTFVRVGPDTEPVHIVHVQPY